MSINQTYTFINAIIYVSPAGAKYVNFCITKIVTDCPLTLVTDWSLITGRGEELT